MAKNTPFSINVPGVTPIQQGQQAPAQQPASSGGQFNSKSPFSISVPGVTPIQTSQNQNNNSQQPAPQKTGGFFSKLFGFNKNVNQPATQKQATFNKFVAPVKSAVGSNFALPITNDIGKNAPKKTPGQIIGDTLDSLLNVGIGTATVVGNVAAPEGPGEAQDVAEPAEEAAGKEAIDSAIDQITKKGSDVIEKAKQAYNDLSTLGKARTVGAGYGGVQGFAQGLQNKDKAGGTLASTLFGSAVGAGTADLGTRALTKFSDLLAPSAEKAVQNSVDALDPDLTGKKLGKGYTEVATKGRGVTTASIFDDQKLAPNQRTFSLATRLKDLNLNPNPAEAAGNLQKIATDFQTTEANIVKELTGDPEVQYTADKPKLSGELNELKTNKPQEFTSIKDSSKAFNSVVDFAQKLLDGTDDSTMGLRDGRISFDQQVTREYPNAFNPDGTVNTKTPTGSAVKAVRDTWNEHLYDSVPNGSKIKALIAREADLFQAANNIGPKAAKFDGQNTISQIITKYPILKRMVGYGLAAYGLDKLL